MGIPDAMVMPFCFLHTTRAGNAMFLDDQQPEASRRLNTEWRARSSCLSDDLPSVRALVRVVGEGQPIHASQSPFAEAAGRLTSPHPHFAASGDWLESIRHQAHPCAMFGLLDALVPDQSQNQPAPNPVVERCQTHAEPPLVQCNSSRFEKDVTHTESLRRFR